MAGALDEKVRQDKAEPWEGGGTGLEQSGQFFAVGGWEGFGNDARGELYDPFADGGQRAGTVSFPNLVDLSSV